VDGNYARYPGNPWLVNTLWLADWIIARARRRGDLAAARDFLEWTAMRALPSGVLAEQLHPDTGAPLSVSPLTWSHAAFVSTVLQYLGKRCRLSDGS
jgi:GH15 family glucan-1,4-alpha-glucosidase